MKFENYIYSEIKDCPSMFKNIDFESSTQDVLEYVFLVTWNGMKVDDIQKAILSSDSTTKTLDLAYFDSEILIEKEIGRGSKEEFKLSEDYYNLMRDWKLTNISAAIEFLDNRWIKSYEEYVEYYKIQPGYNEMTKREYYKKDWVDWLFYKIPLISNWALSRKFPNWTEKEYHPLNTWCLLEETILSGIDLPEDWIEWLFEFYAKIKPITTKYILEWKTTEYQTNGLIKAIKNIDKYFKEKGKIVQYDNMEEDWEKLIEKSKSFKTLKIGKLNK